ncbi:MAG: hypothetical protein WAN18_29165 [Candidatus Sulfotelmatobacter sp.]
MPGRPRFARNAFARREGHYHPYQINALSKSALLPRLKLDVTAECERWEKEGSKSDKVDARKLAELLRTGMLRPVYHGENGLRTLQESDPKTIGPTLRKETDCGVVTKDSLGLPGWPSANDTPG